MSESDCLMTLSGLHNYRWRQWIRGGHRELRCWCGKKPTATERVAVIAQLNKTKLELERQAAEEGGKAELYPVSGEQEQLL